MVDAPLESIVPAEIGERLMAHLADIAGLALLMGAISLTYFGVFALGMVTLGQGAWQTVLVVYWLLALVVAMGVYLFLIPETGWQATPGKYLLQIQIIKLGGGKAYGDDLFIRYLVIIVSYMILGLGFLPALFDERRRTLHDVIAGTMVVKAPRQMA